MYAPDPELYYSTSARLQWLKAEIARLRLAPYPTDSPHKLLLVLDRSCDRLQELANLHLEDWHAGSKDRGSVEDALRFLHHSIGLIGEYLSIFDTAGFAKARPEIALPLELLIHERIPAAKGDQFIFYATHDFNFFYKHVYRALTGLLFFLDDAEEQEFFRDLPGHIALIAFAAIERDNIFTLIILLHELAHYYDQSQSPPLSRMELATRLDPGALEDWVREAKEIGFVPDFLARQLNVKTAADVPSDVLDFGLTFSILLRVAAAEIWLRELTADIVATRFGGVAFYLTAKKFLGFFPFRHGSAYPANYRRYHEIARVLPDPADGIEKATRADVLCARLPGFAGTTSKVLESIRGDYKTGDVHAEFKRDKPGLTAPMVDKQAYLDYLALQILEKAIDADLQRVRDAARRVFPPEKCCALSERLLHAANYLIERIPPAQTLGERLFEAGNWLKVDEIMAGAWLAWLHECGPAEDPQKWGDRRRITSRLTLRAIELSNYTQRHFAEEEKKVRKNLKEIQEELKATPEGDSAIGKQGVLTRKEILLAMTKRSPADMLVITPMLDAEQIGEASVDVRLGNGFIAVRQARTKGITVTPSRILGPGDYKEEIVLSYDGKIVLHPGEFMLGSTLEYICVPPDMMAYVIGRSSLGRLGLIIATATHVAPGFKGTLTLELSNLGTVPIELTPRIRIAQLVFHRTAEPVVTPYHRRGTYAYTIGPQMPSLETDE